MKNDNGILVFESGSEQATEEFAEKFSASVKPGDIICFFGSVGAGKTVFARGLCRGLGFSGYVNSPSYIIMNLYKCASVTVYHFDLYRITSPHELTETGFYDFAGSEGSITMVEWTEKLGDDLPEKRIEVTIEDTGSEKRTITIKRF
jgi:tRNA threonylcarbamoyladenosine biosynthesis protein TsaE